MKLFLGLILKDASVKLIDLSKKHVVAIGDLIGCVYQSFLGERA